MTKIKSVTFGTDSRGISSGVLGYTILLEPATTSHDLLEEAAKCINIITKHKFAKKYNNIFITGELTSVEEEYAMLTLLKAFKDRGFRIHITTSSTIYHSYYMLADYIKLYLKPDTTWAGFQCNEIVYCPTKEQLIDPDLPEFKMLYTLEVEDTSILYKFLEASKYSWNISAKGKVKEVLYE